MFASIAQILNEKIIISHYVRQFLELFFHTLQNQVALLSKFIHTSKLCLDMRNYATAVAIIDGLENVIVRQVPVSITSFHNLTDIKKYNYQNETPTSQLLSFISNHKIFLF